MDALPAFVVVAGAAMVLSLVAILGGAVVRFVGTFLGARTRKGQRPLI